MDVQIHAAEGALWVTWVHGPEDLGFSVYDAVEDAWSAPAYEEVEDEDFKAACDRVEGSVTGS